MLGALAWQAATIIKMFFCLGGRSHGGYLVLAPGSPPCVPVCSLSAPFVRSDYTAPRFYRRESILELPTKDQSLNSCMWVCVLPMEAHSYLPVDVWILLEFIWRRMQEELDSSWVAGQDVFALPIWEIIY